MRNTIYRERASGELKEEKVYGKFFLEALYGSGLLSSLFSLIALPLISYTPFFSKWYGRRQKSKKSVKKVVPFIKDFGVDTSEFADSSESFSSFNDFFIRKLKPEARPIAEGEKVLSLPADGRYLVFQNIAQSDGFYVKEKNFDLSRLLKDPTLFEKYKEGSMMIARLCPTDYHRFHFPCDCTPKVPKLINGPLFSVNPLALKKHIAILGENKRILTSLETKHFGEVLYIEVGATCVGSIKQTFTPDTSYKKGDEKGYFEFGGSCLILLFEPGAIVFDDDLIQASSKQIETYAKMGETLARPCTIFSE